MNNFQAERPQYCSKHCNKLQNIQIRETQKYYKKNEKPLEDWTSWEEVAASALMENLLLRLKALTELTRMENRRFNKVFAPKKSRLVLLLEWTEGESEEEEKEVGGSRVEVPSPIPITRVAIAASELSWATQSLWLLILL